METTRSGNDQFVIHLNHDIAEKNRSVAVNYAQLSQSIG